VSDWWGWMLADDGAAVPGQGAQLWAVDVSAPAAPSVLATIPVAGSLLTSRLVGDVLYTVARSAPWCWGVLPPGGGLAGIAASPVNDEVTVESFDVSDPGAPRAVASLAIPVTAWADVHAHATAERLTLALSGWEGNALSTRLLAVDLSDPGGALAQGTEAVAPGSIRDRFAMDFDAGSGVLRAVLDDGWSRGATVRTWSAPDAAVEPVELAQLALAPTETLTAARFDGGRAYVVTAVRRDPLWVVDVRDPAHPALLGHLEMPGQLDYIEPRGDRLVALGHTDEAGSPWQLAVSLFDVSGGAPQLLARVPFGGDFGWITASADDVRKAFQVLDDEGLVVVPFQSWDADTWRGVGGTQLLALDGDGLADAGFLPGLGAVLRAVPLEGKPHHLVAFSEARLQVIDATDRAAPRELAALDLARQAWDVALAGGAVAALGGDWYSGAGELTVTTPEDPDAPSPLARVALDAPASRVFGRGAIAWVLLEDWRTSSTSLEAIDLSDPTSPRRRGRLVLRPPGSAWGYVSVALSPTAPVLAVHVTTYAAGAATGELSLVDLSDPDRPAVAWSGAFGGNYGGDLGWEGSRVRFTRYEWASREDAWVRFWLERLEAADPRAPVRLPSVNVPGAFLAASDDGGRVWTVEASWDRPEAPRTRVHALAVDGGRARLVGTIELEGGAAGGIARGGHAWLVTSIWSASGATARLHALDLGAMRAGDGLALEGGWPWPLGVAGEKLLVAASWPASGVIVLDVADPLRPSLARFERTGAVGWNMVADAERAYLAAGPYGIVTVPLGP
jgi:hypothetical protein